jgi:two-component system, sensor histidine kinase PdtaS
MKTAILVIIAAMVSVAPARAQGPDQFLASLPTDHRKADTLLALANRQYFRSRFDSAIYLLNKGMLYAEKAADEELLFRYLLALASAYNENRQHTEALRTLQRAAPLAKRSTVAELRLKYLMVNAFAYKRLHRTDSALHFLYAAEALNNAHSPYNNWAVYLQIALMFDQAGDYPEADKHFSNSFELAKTKGIRADYGFVLFHYRNMVYRWGRADKFARLMEEQQRFQQSSPATLSIDPTHRVMFVDWSKKTFAESVSFLENVKVDFQQRGKLHNIATANHHLAELYEREKLFDKAIACLRENGPLLQGETNLELRFTNSKLLYRMLKQAGKTEEALAEAGRLFSIKDSLDRLLKKNLMLELEAKYETAKKEKDLVLLNAENKLTALQLVKETELKQSLLRQNNLKDSVVQQEKNYNLLLQEDNIRRTAQLRNEQQLKAALTKENGLRSLQLQKEQRLRTQLQIAAALLLFSGVTIFLLYRRQRRKNKLIQKQSDDLEVLMKEIHHRVKNNLQIISSLLDLQSLSIADKEASQAVREGKNRVLSMALIHQNLYTEGNIKGIRVQEYICSLSNSLFDSYNIQRERIRLQTDIDPLTLDVDTVIPIGLIINELISNSLKYAFAGREEGTILVALKQKEKALLLQVSDNGHGFSPGWMQQERSFGYKLIKAFAQKLKAKLDVCNNDGACVTMIITKYKTAGEAVWEPEKRKEMEEALN